MGQHAADFEATQIAAALVYHHVEHCLALRWLAGDKPIRTSGETHAVNTLEIRDETEADRPAIRAIHVAAFPGPDEAALVDRLRADGDLVLSLVAVESEGIVGHIAFSRMTAPFRALGLAPVAVRPDRQHRGTGGRLILAGLERARAGGWDCVFVLGDNAYYERFGFSCEAAEGFRSRYSGPHFMALALNSAPAATSGDAAYAPAFDALA